MVVLIIFQFSIKSINNGTVASTVQSKGLGWANIKLQKIMNIFYVLYSCIIIIKMHTFTMYFILKPILEKHTM